MPNRSEKGYNPNIAKAVRTLATYAAVASLWVTLACGPSGIEATSSTSTPSEYMGSESVLVIGGDSYTSIAGRCDIPLGDIKEANNGIDLDPGDIIQVPLPNECRGSEEVRAQMNELCSLTSVVVDYEDSLNSIANKVNQKVELVALATGYRVTDALKPGQSLNVPVSCKEEIPLR